MLYIQKCFTRQSTTNGLRLNSNCSPRLATKKHRRCSQWQVRCNIIIAYVRSISMRWSTMVLLSIAMHLTISCLLAYQCESDVRIWNMHNKLRDVFFLILREGTNKVNTWKYLLNNLFILWQDSSRELLIYEK